MQNTRSVFIDPRIVLASRERSASPSGGLTTPVLTPESSSTVSGSAITAVTTPIDNESSEVDFNPTAAGEQQPYRCHLCGKQFARQYKLKYADLFVCLIRTLTIVLAGTSGPYTKSRSNATDAPAPSPNRKTLRDTYRPFMRKSKPFAVLSEVVLEVWPAMGSPGKTHVIAMLQRTIDRAWSTIGPPTAFDLVRLLFCYLESYVPSDKRVALLYSVDRLGLHYPRLQPAAFPQSSSCVDRLLPKALAIRGLVWSSSYFRSDFYMLQVRVGLFLVLSEDELGLSRPLPSAIAGWTLHEHLRTLGHPPTSAEKSSDRNLDNSCSSIARELRRQRLDRRPRKRLRSWWCMGVLLGD